VADITPPESRGAAFGLRQLSGAYWWVVAIGAVFTATFSAGAGFSLLAAILILSRR
jgi:hypothetical protein